ncbi:hypothetical protein F4703DRAFT_1750765, partial [Phycomyces blakesleeanus]
FQQINIIFIFIFVLFIFSYCVTSRTLQSRLSISWTVFAISIAICKVDSNETGS